MVMNDLMTIGEIEAHFPEEWILIDHPETDVHDEVVRGRVVFHSPDRDEVYRKALDVPAPRHIAFHCTKKPKPDEAFVL
jgi:hypothetical protein